MYSGQMLQSVALIQFLNIFNLCSVVLSYCCCNKLQQSCRLKRTQIYSLGVWWSEVSLRRDEGVHRACSYWTVKEGIHHLFQLLEPVLLLWPVALHHIMFSIITQPSLVYSSCIPLLWTLVMTLGPPE